jgi:fatty acid synthase subunit alpha
LLLSEFQTKKTVEIGPSETLTNMMKRTRDLVYRPFDTANSISRNFLSLKRNKQDIYFAAPRGEAVTAVTSVSATPPAAPHQPAVSTTPAAGPVEDTPVSAADVIRTIVAIALRKSAKDVSFDSSVKALSGG